MKYLAFVLVPLFIVACNAYSDDGNGDSEGGQEKINAPTTLRVVRGDNFEAVLSWVDNSDNEEGFIIERKSSNSSASYKEIARVEANVTLYSDLMKEPRGTYYYRVTAYRETSLSESVTKMYQHVDASSLAVLSQPEITGDFSRITVKYKLVSNVNNKSCSAGVCWSESQNPIVDDFEVKSSDNASPGKDLSQMLPDFVFEYGKEYYLRAYAVNDYGISYSRSVKISHNRDIEPSNPGLQWEKVTTALPDEISVYKTTTKLSGNMFKAWYAIADLSTNKVGLKVNQPSQATNISNQAKALGSKCLVLVNGGYFGGNSAYGLSVVDGVKRGNASAIKRGAATGAQYDMIYPVTPAAFGVDASGKCEAAWTYDNGTAIWKHKIPLVSIVGESLLPAASKTNPTVGEPWNPIQAIGAGPMLLKGGRIIPDFSKTSKGYYKANYEIVWNDIYEGRCQRTAIGRTADDKIILFVCDGRFSTYSVGANLMEVAAIMKSLGCVDAMNLDGGGSSTFVVSGNKLNLPSGPESTYERPVMTSVGFVLK